MHAYACGQWVCSLWATKLPPPDKLIQKNIIIYCHIPQPTHFVCPSSSWPVSISFEWIIASACCFLFLVFCLRVCHTKNNKFVFFFTPERFQWKFIFGVFFFFVLRVSPFCIIKRCSSNFKFIGESGFFPFMFDSKKCSAIKFIRAKQKKILLFYRFEISAICMLCIYVQSHKMEKKKTILANKILYNCA